jgi:hypothetical protein
MSDRWKLPHSYVIWFWAFSIFITDLEQFLFAYFPVTH